MDYITAFEQSVSRTPDGVAIRNPGSDSCTYDELHQRTTDLALALDGLIGDARSGSLLDNGQSAIEILLAAYKRGVANVPLNTQSAPDQQVFILKNSDVDVLLFDDANRERAVEIIDWYGLDIAVHVGDAPVELDGVTVHSYESLLADVAADPDDYETRGSAGGIYYTSGTTGRPKGVIADQEKSWYASSQLIMDSAISPTDRALIATPLYHVVTAVSWTFAHLQANATLVPQQSFAPGQTLDLIEKYDITNVFMIPAQWEAVLDEQRAAPRDIDTIRQARTGGAPVDEEVVVEIRDEITENFYIIYGLTESVSNVTVGRPADQRRSPGTVGKATFNWETRVVESVDPAENPDPDTVIDPPGSGELLVRSVVGADGYLDRPEAEQDLFVNDWIRTGDIARIDEDRNLYIVDRVDNMIISGGENIYPQEVETVLSEHSDVTDAATIGVPHEKWGETVKGIVVPASADLTADELDRYCRDSDRLADFKRPRKYEFVEDELPRSPLGKLRRGVIRDKFSE